MPDLTVRLDLNGPLSDGRTRQAVTDYVDDVGHQVAARGEQLVNTALPRVLRHPTGYYQSRIHTERVAFGRHEVNDDGVVYGPWLEGTGSRNAPVTRFPGYFTFRRSTATLERQADGIAQQVLRRYQARGLG